MERIEILSNRLAQYYEAESAILRGAEYQIGDRRLRRPDLSAVRAAIRELENEIAMLERRGGRVKQVVFVD